MVNRIDGGLKGYSGGKPISNWNLPFWYGVDFGPIRVTSHLLRSSSLGRVIVAFSNGDCISFFSSYIFFAFGGERYGRDGGINNDVERAMG